MNSEQFKNSGFARLYLWTTKAKYTMGLFFVVFVLFYLLMGMLCKTPVVLDFYTAFQMMFACFAIGILQQVFIPAEKLSFMRCAFWVASGVLTALFFNFAFGWYTLLPTWCFYTFLLFLAMGMAALIVSHYLELHRETKLLNRSLEQYQKRHAQTEDAPWL